MYLNYSKFLMFGDDLNLNMQKDINLLVGYKFSAAVSYELILN